MSSTHDTASPEETFELAKAIAAEHPECPAYYLTGDLGAGKTVLTKGLAAHFDVDPAVVTSPTFALVNRYGGGRRVVYHIDLYRIEHDRELDELGLEEMEEEGALLVVEWAEKLAHHRRPDAIPIHLDVTGEGKRRIVVGS